MLVDACGCIVCVHQLLASPKSLLRLVKQSCDADWKPCTKISRWDKLHDSKLVVCTHIYLLFVLNTVSYFQNQLNEKHILRIPVRWVEGGLDLQLPDHAQYVTEVTSQLGKHLRGVVDTIIEEDQAKVGVNPLNPKLNPICYLLALLGAHHFLHVSRIRVKLLTFR